MFRYLLRLPNGEPYDPPAFVTVMPTWHVGDEFLITHDRRLRILAIDADIPDELFEQGFNAIWTIDARTVEAAAIRGRSRHCRPTSAWSSGGPALPVEPL
jgi:hypothetical protein